MPHHLLLVPGFFGFTGTGDFGCFASGSGFTRPQFEQLWKRIATWLGAGAA